MGMKREGGVCLPVEPHKLTLYYDHKCLKLQNALLCLLAAWTPGINQHPVPALL